MDGPNDLNKLLAELVQVARASGLSEVRRAGSRPSEAEVERFLSRYNFDPDKVVERIVIQTNGAFELYMFAVWQASSGELSLFTMLPG